MLHCFPSSSSPSSAASTSAFVVTRNSVDALPKLVSVAEVIKREYLRFLIEVASVSVPPSVSNVDKGKGIANEDENASSEDSKRVMPGQCEGLHQYTRLTTFEALGFDTSTVTKPKEVGDTKEQSRKEREEQAELERQELIKLEWLTGKPGSNKR